MTGDHTAVSAAHARVALAALWAQLAEYASAHVSCAHDDDAAPGEFVTSARRAAVLASELVHLAVVHERLSGTDWEHLSRVTAMPLDALLEEYETVVDTFRKTGVPAWRPPIAGLMPDLPGRGDLHRVAAALDQWCAARDEQAARPVSRVLDGRARIGRQAADGL